MMEKYVRKKTLWLVLFAAAVLLSAGQCFASIPAKPTSSIYCQDLAGILDAKLVSQINKISADLYNKCGAQVTVLTINSLDGQALEDYSLQVLRTWGIGDKAKNNGVLILVAVQDKKSRIEVGYGLEGALPDGKTGRIQDEYMLPSFKKGNYSEGVWQGYQAIVFAVANEYKVDVGQGQRAPPAAQSASDGQQMPTWMMILIGIGVLILLIVDWVFFGGTFTWLIIALIFRRGGGSSGGGGDSFGGGSGGGGGSSRSW